MQVDSETLQTWAVPNLEMMDANTKNHQEKTPKISKVDKHQAADKQQEHDESTSSSGTGPN
jgi:hypothetical protein